MVTPIEARPVPRPDTSATAPTTVPVRAATIPAIAIAALAAGATDGGASAGEQILEQTSAREREEAARAVSAALAGDPQALIALIATQLRARQGTVREQGVRVSQAQADSAEAARQRAVEEARRAAEDADGFLGLGDTFETIALVAGIVAAACASVVTGGSALVVAGVLLVALADPIADGLVDAGVISEDDAQHVSGALKMAGAAMMSAGVAGLVAGVAGAALATYGDDISRALVEEGVISADVGAWLGTGLCIAGSIMMGQANANGVNDAARSGASLIAGEARDVVQGVGTAARVCEGGARVGQSGAKIAEAGERRIDQQKTADATEHGAAADDARDRADEWIETLKSSVQQFARMMRAVREIAEARAQAQRTAATMRA